MAATAVTIEKLRKFGVEIGAMTINLATLFHRSHGDCGASAKCFETFERINVALKLASRENVKAPLVLVNKNILAEINRKLKEAKMRGTY